MNMCILYMSPPTEGKTSSRREPCSEEVGSSRFCEVAKTQRRWRMVVGTVVYSMQYCNTGVP